MQFYENQIFHLYNQGNNRTKIFFSHENYLFFLRKAREFVLPYADILPYCLMPNHFHKLVYVNKIEIEISKDKIRTINKSIGIMLMSYTSAINKQEGTSGSLFRQHSKIKDGWEDDARTVGSRYEKLMFSGDNLYGRVCFEYIHNNPVKAGLVKNPEEWPYSSASDYKGIRNGTLCNQKVAKNLLLF